MKLLNTFREFFTPTNPTTAFIDNENRLFAPTGEFVHQYARRRDAVRGATRRGFALA